MPSVVRCGGGGGGEGYAKDARKAKGVTDTRAR